MNARVKICCISSQEEAATAVRHGVSAIGLVGRMPSGPGVISDDMIREIAGAVPPGVSVFLLTSETTARGIIDHHKRTNTPVLQIVDYVRHEVLAEVKRTLPAVKIVQVIHVTGDDDVKLAAEYSAVADALLLDSGNPYADVKVLGGTGKTHNWDLSRKIVSEVRVPVFLAGGLSPLNVKEAVDYVKPYGVDICSGLRTNGMLDSTKVAEFFRNING
ncbi:MAG: phosphoribosylanthranilate isomerase [Ignavibacteriaceae bacterium]|nr:phosphoribosylanthranilate isomerase [Ignavibacteriaceae bacterium]